MCAMHEQWAHHCNVAPGASGVTSKRVYESAKILQKACQPLCDGSMRGEEGAASLRQPECANADAIVGFVTGRAATHNSRILAIHHWPWPYIA